VRLEPIGPWAVTRCHLATDGDAPRSVVVKWLRDDPRGLRTDRRQVATERAALEFLEEIGFASAPRLIASDLGAAVLILEDLAPRVALADRLRAEGSSGLERELIAFARALGELGAATAGRQAAFEAHRARYGPADPAAERPRGFGPQWPSARARLAASGLELPPPADAELAAVAETLASPGPLWTLGNGDPAPNNFLVGNGGGRLIDFEFAAYCLAPVAAVWMYVPDPAWITVAHPARGAMEAAYRAALAQGAHEAEDDVAFGGAIAAACLAYACDRFSRFDLLDGRVAGDRSRLQMVSTLEAAAGAARRHRAFPELAGFMEGAGAWLRRRWPDADVDLSRLAPFTPR